MQGRRVERVAKLVREELGQMVIRRVKDPFMQGMTITDVKVSPDLSVARVFFNCPVEDRDRISKALERASSFLRRELGAQLHLKKTPELRFQHDDSLDQGMHIDSILRELSEDKAGEEP